MLTALAPNSWSSCLSLWNARITGVCHCTWLDFSPRVSFLSLEAVSASFTMNRSHALKEVWQVLDQHAWGRTATAMTIPYRLQLTRLVCLHQFVCVLYLFLIAPLLVKSFIQNWQHRQSSLSTGWISSAFPCLWSQDATQDFMFFLVAVFPCVLNCSAFLSCQGVSSSWVSKSTPRVCPLLLSRWNKLCSSHLHS